MARISWPFDRHHRAGGSALPAEVRDGEAQARLTVTIVALTLNEIDGVRHILPKIDRSWYDQLIVLDGNSTDGTVQWCRDHGYNVCLQQRAGIRHAYLEVLPQISGDIVLTLSPDGNCDPAMIPVIIEKVRQGYDLVIGSRYLGDASSDDDDLVTGFGNWLFTRTVNLLHRARYTDCMVIYRAFRKDLVYELDLHEESSYRLPERLFGTVISWEPLMSVRAAKAGKRISEIPAGEPERIGGHRKLQILRWGAAYYFQFWRELWFWNPTHSNGPGSGKALQSNTQAKSGSC
jgi:glycosyltransferase involved in cell wall biosynthesis